jgi:hypothetical protein
MSVARTARFALVVAFLAACATAALADYFDPVQTYSSLSSSVGFSTDRYLGQGTAVADGRVIFPPAAASASRVGIYDPNGNSGTGSFTLTLTVPSAYYSYYTSALMLDGRVCFVPYFKDKVAVFDPATDSLEYFDTGSTTDRKYNGGVAANDGRIIMAPYDEDGVGVFDPTVDPPTFTKFTFTTHPSATGNNAYEGAAKAGQRQDRLRALQTVDPRRYLRPGNEHVLHRSARRAVLGRCVLGRRRRVRRESCAGAYWAEGFDCGVRPGHGTGDD